MMSSTAWLSCGAGEMNTTATASNKPFPPLYSNFMFCSQPHEKHEIPFYSVKKGDGIAPSPFFMQQLQFFTASMIDRFSHAETGILADIDFVKHLFGTLVREHQRSKNSGEEAERDGDQTWVLQLQDRFAEAHD